MNAVIAKTELNAVSETDLAQPELAAGESAEAASFADEILLVERTDRKIYRRSAAYFLFGFGPNKHSIITDET